MESMTQTLLTVLVFVVLLAALPALLRRIKARQGLGFGAMGPDSRVISALAVGPQQRVVTVEVGPAHARVWLVLGVTQQSIQCLHQCPAQGAGAGAAGSTPPAPLP